MGKGGADPKAFIGACAADFANGGGGFYNSGKHRPKIKLQKAFVCLPFCIIFAVLIIKGGIKVMLINDSKDCENIDKALKKYNKKFEKAKILVQLRERQSYTKPSVKRRGEVLKAIYKLKVSTGQIES